jgi:PAS domain S-box-containing protein
MSLQDFFNEFLQFASSFSEFGLLPKGALFLVDEDKPETLQMMAHYNLTAPLPKLCNQVPFGHCLCGRAAATGKIVFASHIDERHDNTYEGIQPHGHYCIPIFSRSNRVLGVYNVYTKNNAAHDERLEDLLTSVASVLANIIEHKTAERQSLESHAKHRAITNTASDSIIMIDHHGQITFWNPAAEKLFGYNRSEVLGQDLHNLIAPLEFREKAHTGFKDFITTGQGPLIGKALEMSGLKKDGTIFPVELSTSAVKQGNHWAAIAILRDISARKDLEGEKLKIAQQIRQAQKMEAIGTLAGGIAHDFNNILSSILGYAELVKEDMSPTCIESLHDLDQVIIAGKRAKELVKQILTFSRQTEEEAQPIQISLVIKETIKLLQATLPKNIEIQQMISAGSEVVLCDPSQIHQLIMNLCTNSYQAMRDAGGTLEVRLESFSPDDTFVENHPDLPAARYLRLTVSDTGQGIGPAVLPRIFEPYFSTKKKGEGGTGLGLAVAHGIVKRLAGAIEVNSELGVGTIFKVYLPVLNEQISPDKPLPDLPIHGSENILLVDDELSLLELEERTLAPLGYKTVCRTSSIEALELFRNDPDRFDLVVTDHNMPNMTGAQMAEEMVNIRPDIPIILCTGYSELDISAAIMGKCIRKTIMKPVSKKELAHSIREVLGRNRNQ